MDHNHDHPGNSNDHDDHGHGHHGHGHGHEDDQGWRAMLRYAGHARTMWSSDVNDAVVARIAPKVGETVMDIGAGVGAGSVVAARTGATVIAVEPTPYMRKILRARCVLSRISDRVQIVDGAAEATTAADNSVDAAWAVNTMHHWTNMSAGVDELARVLKPGGRVLLVDEHFDDPAHPDYETFGAKRDQHEHHFHMVDPEEVGEHVRSAGLTVQSAAFDTINDRPAIIVEATKPAS